ncbi:MAG: AzlD domain-containing protein [Clostridiales bacterium]|nr:AzlD domain-containing protein [Clostridiales bacterium]
MSGNVYIYILVMALVTYLVRMLPLTLIRRTIKSNFLRSFLHYVPYVTLSVMTFPAILSATSSPWSGLAGFITALVLSYKGKGLILVSLTACAVVFILELALV